MYVMKALLKNVALWLQTHQRIDNCNVSVAVSVAKNPIHNHIHSEAAVRTFAQCERKSGMMKPFEMWHSISSYNPTGVAVCLFEKWLLTLGVDRALQRSKINGAHALPCCIPNWFEPDQTFETLGAFS